MTTPRDRRKVERTGRALQRQAFLAERAGTFDRAALDAAVAGADRRGCSRRHRRRDAPAGPPRKPRRRHRCRRRSSTGGARRWVPIGPPPSARVWPTDRPRVGGRVRDIWVEPVNGRRAYAASAKGGVWYTEDGGAPGVRWAAGRTGPAGAAARTMRSPAAACWSASAPTHSRTSSWWAPARSPRGHPGGDRARPVRRHRRAVGDGSSRGGDWRQSLGGAVRPHGVGGSRHLSDGAGPGGGRRQNAVPALDRVLAATSGGLFLGSRRNVAVPAPAHDEFNWVKLAGPDALLRPGRGRPSPSSPTCSGWPAAPPRPTAGS